MTEGLMEGVAEVAVVVEVVAEVVVKVAVVATVAGKQDLTLVAKGKEIESWEFQAIELSHINSSSFNRTQEVDWYRRQSVLDSRTDLDTKR